MQLTFAELQNQILVIEAALLNISKDLDTYKEFKTSSQAYNFGYAVAKINVFRDSYIELAAAMRRLKNS